MQRRRGPNVVGFLGLFQPFADAVKLLAKQTTVPMKADYVAFFLSPLITFFLSVVSWIVIPVGQNSSIIDVNLGMLYIFAVSSLGVYGIIISGWSSNSRYAFLGSLRSAAQMISYEVSIGLILVSVAFCARSFNLSDIINFQKNVWFVVPLFPLFIMFFVSSLAETNRSPFDLPEAEAELVSGYNVEYSSVGFVFFFISEYANIILMSSLSVIFFFGGWLPPFQIAYIIPESFWFTIKILAILFLFVWVRAAYPRYRYDQLMRLGWKVFLPLSVGSTIFTSCIITSFIL
jgi:NADH-quinone oxidoreductase subunit H